MTRTSPPARRTARLGSTALAIGALVLTSTLPGTAFAAAPGSGHQLSATLVLRTPNPPATSALAQSGGLSRADRLGRLSATLPSAAEQASVRDQVSGLGLVVDDTTPWTVVVHGAAATVQQLTDAGRLTGVGSVVLGGQGPRMVPMAEQPLSGADFRTTYQASSAAPPAGSSAPVIATLQYAGWDSSELAAYATAATLPAPAVGQFTAVSVDGASTTLDDHGGSVEVALDQESIYSTNPFAVQRAYFTPNSSTQGSVDAYYAIAQDALTSSSIVALSVSWGFCEQEYPAAATAIHAAITALVATGVSVFASSGDDGAMCSDRSVGVNYPASDPLVVAVGGTTLDLAGPVETGWGAVDTSSTAGFDGSGGGPSSVFPQPAYQSAAAIKLAGPAWRELPDIAADADPDTGFNVLHNRGDGSGLRSRTYGGTSLASPISAALLTAELGSRGLTNGGVGDLHTVLYSAPATSFRDIVSGYNLFNAGPGYDLVTGLGAPNWHALVDQLVQAPVVSTPAFSPSKTFPVTAAAPGGQVVIGWLTGYGTPPPCVGHSAALPLTAAPAPVTVPGDGSYPVWAQAYLGYQRCLTGTTTVVVDGTGPSVALSATASSATAKSVSFGWTVWDAVSGVATVSASVQRNGKKIWAGTPNASGAITLKGQLGSIYQLTLVATDKAGNTATAAKSLTVAYDDRGFRLSPGWSRVGSRSAFGGTLVTSAKSGATAKLSAYGATFSLLTRTCPTCGLLAVFVGGKHVRDLNLYSKQANPHVTLKLASFGSVNVRSITLVVKGAKGRQSKGVNVSVDGLLAG